MQKVILDSFDDIVSVKDENLKYIYVNNSFMKKLCKNTSTNTKPESIYDIENVSENVAKLTEHHCLSVLKTKKPAVFVFKLKIQNTLHFFQQTISPIVNENEKTKLISITRDITQEKEINYKKEQTLATLTHDLKNPLQAQIRGLELLQKGTFGVLTQEQNETLGLILESAKYMKQLMYSVLQAYKTENGTLEMKKTYFDAENLVQTCLKEVSSLAFSKNITLILHSSLKNNEKLVLGDEKQIRRVVSNLLTNGVSYAFEGTQFVVTIEKTEEIYSFRFQTTSPEITDDLKKKLFNRYESASQDGIGLGLYLSKKVIEAHGGQIYHSGINNLNVFSFELPVKPDKTLSSTVVW